MNDASTRVRPTSDRVAQRSLWAATLVLAFGALGACGPTATGPEPVAPTEGSGVTGAPTSAPGQVALPAPDAPVDAEASARGGQDGAEAGTTAAVGGGRLGAAAPGRVRFEIYIMSKCPFAEQALAGLLPALQALGPEVELVAEYIGTVAEDGSLSSMHGDTEVVADLAQICVAKHAPTRSPAFLACQVERGIGQAELTWGECAAQTGVDGAALATCMRGAEGRNLLAASFERSRVKGARGSPTIYVAGQRYEGRRSTGSFMRAACTWLGDKAVACHQLPTGARVDVTLINDARCSDCRAERLETMIRARLESPSLRTLDWSAPEAKRLFAASGAETLPVALFDASLEADPDGAADLGRYLEGQAPLRYLRSRDGWRPQCHDPGGCRRAECTSDLSCRAEIPKRLDVFIMSQCPFAAKALTSLQTVVADFGRDLELQVHHITTGDAATGFRSMHGQGEVDEDLRQACAAKLGARGRADLRYIWCRVPEYRSADWRACTGARSGLDATALERCATSPQGLKLLEKSSKLARDLDIGASPTFVVNNRYQHSGNDVDTIERFYCAHNPTLPRCRALPAPGSQPATAPSPGADPSCQ